MLRLYAFPEPPPPVHGKYDPRNEHHLPDPKHPKPIHHYEKPIPHPPEPVHHKEPVHQPIMMHYQEPNVIKIPYQKPEEVYVLSQREILPTPIPHKVIHPEHPVKKHVIVKEHHPPPTPKHHIMKPMPVHHQSTPLPVHHDLHDPHSNHNPHHPHPAPTTHYEVVHHSPNPKSSPGYEVIHLKPTPKPSIHYELIQHSQHPKPSPHYESVHSPTPSPHYEVVNHHSPAPTIPVKMHFKIVNHDMEVGVTPAPVTIAPALFDPHHSPAVSHRRYSISDEEEIAPSVKRPRPTSYNDISNVSPTTAPFNINYNTPLQMTPSPVTVKSPIKMIQYSTSTPTTPPPVIRYSSTPNIQYTTPAPTMVKYSTPSSTVFQMTTPAPAPAPKNVYHSEGGPYVTQGAGPTLPPIQYNPKPLLVHKGDPLPVDYQSNHYDQINSQHSIPVNHYYDSNADINQEEPEFLVQLVPNPKYNKKEKMMPSMSMIPSRPKPTRRRMEKNLGVGTAKSNIHQDQDPSLYPFLYVLSSYLPETHHSLVVAKKS